MLYFVVVLYNKKIENSPCCQSLLRQKSGAFSVIVVDNSNRELLNGKACETNNWVYIGDGINHGLSKAYNSAISHIDGNDNDYVCLLDDDTRLPDSFACEAANAVSANGTDIILPVAFQNGKILSPWRESRLGFISFYSSAEDCLKTDTNKLLAFNSGMLVSLKLFSDIQYDENLFLDGVDIAFLKAAKSAGKTISVAPISIEQHFSGISDTDRESALARYRIYLADSRKLYNNERIKLWLITGKRALHLAMKFRTCEPLKAFFTRNK